MPLLLLVIMNAVAAPVDVAGDGSSVGVCALPEAQRVPPVSRWALTSTYVTVGCF